MPGKPPIPGVPPECPQDLASLAGGKSVAGPSHDVEVFSRSVIREAAGLMTALMATGESPVKAFAAVADSMGCETARSIFGLHQDCIHEDVKSWWGGIEGLELVAKAVPAVADAWLQEGLASGRIEEWEDDNGFVGFHFSYRGWITSLPAGMQVEGDLNLYGCESLIQLPEDLQVGGHLYLSGCASLKNLPDGLSVGGYLIWCGAALTCLPNGLQVGEYLDLRNCASLVALPMGLQVGGCLDMTGCHAWDGRIPDDAEIVGMIYTDQHPGGVRMAELKI